MSTTGKDEMKVITTEGQSQQGGQDSQSTPQKGWRANDPIAQRIAKRKELRDKIVKPLNEVDLKTPTNPNKQSESIIPYKEEVESVEPFDFDQAYKDAKNEVDMTRSLHDTEREGEENRQKNRRIMTAIGDGLSGLANIYFTSQGTPDLLKGAPSLTGKMQERYDKMRKDAETRRANYLKVVQEGADQKVKDMYTRYKDELEAKRKEEELELKRNKDARDEIKANYEAKKAKLNADLLTHKIDEAKYNADIAEAERNYANELLQAKINRYNRTGTGRSSGGGSGRGSSATGYKIEYTFQEDKDGNMVLDGNNKPIRTGSIKTVGNPTPNKGQKTKPTGRKASSVSYKRKQKNT